MIAVVTALVAACATLLLARPVLHRLPAPLDADANPYLQLDGSGFALVAGALSLAAGLVVAARVPETPLLWLGLTTAGVLSVSIDARTTYLPLRLSQAAWVLTAVGLLASLPVLGPSGLLRGVLGAAAGGAVGWAMWRWGQVGFGDVRLLATTGTTTAALSWQTWWTGLLAGAVLGALVGVGFAVVRRRDAAFPYGPALLAGTFVALLLRP